MANHSLDVAVLVTTEKTYKESGIGKWMTLGDYQDKQSFIQDAKAFCTESLECDGDLYFVDVQPDFNVDELITKTNIDSTVWDFIALDDADDIKTVQSYIACYEIDENIKQTLKTANKAFYGHFESDSDMAADIRYDLCYKNLPADRGVFNNLDITKLTNQEMAGELMKHMSVCDNYYFWDSEA